MVTLTMDNVNSFSRKLENRQFSQLIFALALAFSVMSCSGGNSQNTVAEPQPSQPTPMPAPAPERIEDKLQLIVNKVAANSAGMSVALIKSGEVIFQANAGMANIQNSQSINSQTGYRIASISKSFTALAVMQLYEQGLLSLEDSILEYVPELPEAWRDITIHHLLSHRSGIPDYINDLPNSYWPTEVTRLEVLAYLRSNPRLEFTPGNNQQYSNSGYFLLSEIVASASGKQFSDYMEQHLFVPLGMNNSYILDSQSKQKDSDAINYANTSLIFNKWWLAPGASGQVSSIDDFIVFFTALKNNEIVTQSTLNLMTTEYASNIFGNAYGYGFMLNANDAQFKGHGGLLGGFITEMRIHSGQDWALIVLSNNGSGQLVYSIVGTVHEHFDSSS